MVITLPVSRFAQNYNQHLRSAETTDDVVVLRQRADRPTWVLTSERRHRADAQVTDLLTDTLVALTQQDESMSPAIARAMSTAMPWVSFLPEADRSEFIESLLQTVQTCAAVGNNAAVSELIENWRNTAAIHSDPALAATLSTPLDDPLDEPVE